MKRQLLLLMMAAMCSPLANAQQGGNVRLMTLDPGHFHAGLVQKFMYPEVSPTVHVYSPGGPELKDHLARVEGFNSRSENPTKWQEIVYTGPDFLERMTKEKPGNVVVISGNNQRKTDYIYQSVKAGLNVLADKPMAINSRDFDSLRKAFDTADKKNVLLYDIMTERYEITSILQRELARDTELFGVLDKGTASDPAVIKESVHHYSKEVAGKPLIRPPWFFDIEQQGEAVPDVGTHLVDLVQWACFPDEVINWKKDIKVLSANRWATPISREQFKKATGLDDHPPYLKKYLDDSGTLQVYQNGDVTYALRGVHVKVAVMWRFEAPPGTKDTHFSKVRGTKATMFVRQGAEQNYMAKLYIEPTTGTGQGMEALLRRAIDKLAKTYPGLDMKPAAKGWEIVVPAKHSPGHEEHFTSVTAKYLGFLKEGKMPEWEVPNMIAKYYTTTEAFKLGHSRK